MAPTNSTTQSRTTASIESGALADLYTSMSGRLAANPAMDLVTMRSMFEEVAALASEPEGVTYAESAVGGVSGIWCRPVAAPSDRAALYFHGGGFMASSASSHRKLAGHLARAAALNVFIVDYRLAPEHVFPSQIDDAIDVYRGLLADGLTGDRLAVVGDSAGGNLAMSTVLKLRDLGLPLPSAIVAFAPWIDLENSGESLDTNAATDIMVNRGVVEGMAGVYLGATGSRTDPLVNPLHADLAGLPPVLAIASDSEALRSDAERIVERASAASVTAALSLYSGQQHVFEYMAGRAPEADAAIDEAANWLRKHLP